MISDQVLSLLAKADSRVLTAEEAEELESLLWWDDVPLRAVVEIQLRQPRQCLPRSIYYAYVREVLGRPYMPPNQVSNQSHVIEAYAKKFGRRLIPLTQEKAIA